MTIQLYNYLNIAETPITGNWETIQSINQTKSLCRSEAI